MKDIPSVSLNKEALILSFFQMGIGISATLLVELIAYLVHWQSSYSYGFLGAMLGAFAYGQLKEAKTPGKIDPFISKIALRTAIFQVVGLMPLLVLFSAVSLRTESAGSLRWDEIAMFSAIGLIIAFPLIYFISRWGVKFGINQMRTIKAKEAAKKMSSK